MQKMEIYDSRYFTLNKKLLSSVGIWPYENKKKKILLRIFYGTAMFAMLLPQVVGFYKHFGVDFDELLEHLGTIFFILAMSAKLFTSIYFEKKLMVLYDSIVKNWNTIVDKKEQSILIKYSDRGRMLTIGYITYMLSALVAYTMLPTIPMAMNVFKPLNESRPRMFILNGDFFVDKTKYYTEIYCYDFFCCCAATCIVLSVDTTYAACTEHCLGLFAIIKFRLGVPNEMILNQNQNVSKQKDSPYEWMIQTIKLHSDILNFAHILETSYGPIFLILLGINLVYFSVLSVLVLISFDKPLNFIRYFMLLVGLFIHLFYLSWPGQKLIDHSGGLFEDAYLNQWYETSTRSKNLMKFFRLRCREPCTLTAGGLYTMNFENFLIIMKKSASFITVFSSLR